MTGNICKALQFNQTALRLRSARTELLASNKANLPLETALTGLTEKSVLGTPDARTKRFRLHALSLFCLLSLLGMESSFADNLDVFNLEAGVQRVYDNNLFRLPDAVDPFTV